MHIILCDEIYRREGDMVGILLYFIARSVFHTLKLYRNLVSTPAGEPGEEAAWLTSFWLHREKPELIKLLIK